MTELEKWSMAPTELSKGSKPKCFTMEQGSIIELLHDGRIIRCKLLSVSGDKARVSFLTNNPTEQPKPFSKLPAHLESIVKEFDRQQENFIQEWLQ